MISIAETDELNTGTSKPRIFYGWYIVAVAFLCWFAADAFGWYTFGVFLGPISNDLGWNTSTITGALTMRMVIASLLGPLFGAMVDRKNGARVIMTVGVMLDGIIPIAVSHVHEVWQFYLYYGFIGSLGMVGFGGMVTNAVLSKWFIRKRGRAISIAALGVSIAGMVFIPLSNYLIKHSGWRMTLVFLGIIIWTVTVIPVFLLIRRRPEDIGLRPDGDTIQSPLIEDGIQELMPYDEPEVIWTLKEALRTRALWLLLIGFNLLGLGMSGVFVHLIPYIRDKGFSADMAASAMTILAMFCALVKIPWGLLSERINVHISASICYAGCAVNLFMLVITRSPFFIFLFAVTYGVTLGGDIVLRELVWANYFGRTFLGTIRGMIQPLNIVSMAGGPLFAAWVKDISGGYQTPYTIFIVAAALGTAFVIIARPPVKKKNV